MFNPFKSHKEVLHIDEKIIIVDGRRFHEHDNEERELKIIDKLTGIIAGLLKEKNERERVRLILTTTFNNNQFIIMAINLNSNQFSVDVLSLIDSDNGNAVAASFSNVSFSSSDTGVFTTEQDTSNPNQTTDRAVSAGNASLNISATVSYTDANTGQPVTKDLTLVVPVTVTAIVAGENVELVLTQGTPQTV